MTWKQYVLVWIAWITVYALPPLLPAPDNGLWYPLQAVYSCLLISALFAIVLTRLTLILIIMEVAMVLAFWLAWLDHGNGGGLMEQNILELKRGINAFEFIFLALGLPWHVSPHFFGRRNRLADFYINLSQYYHHADRDSSKKMDRTP